MNPETPAQPPSAQEGRWPRSDLPVPADAGRASAHSAPAASGAAPTVRIELSQAQVGQVIRAASEARSISSLLAGLGDSSQTLKDVYREVHEAGDRHLSSSLLSGLLVLACFPADGAPIANAEVARQLGLNPSTAYRYISTLVVAGLIEKHSDKRRYRLAR